MQRSQYIIKSAKNLEKAMLFYTMVLTAARISEAKLLTRQSFYFDNDGQREPHVLVPTLKKRKAKIPKRYIKLSNTDYIASMSQYLNTIGGLSTKPIFVKDRATYYRWYSALNKQHDLDIQITSHTMRHSMAVHLVLLGFDQLFIKDYLGHSKLSSVDVYTKVGSRLLQSTRPEVVF